jgi:hypothetical protein
MMQLLKSKRSTETVTVPFNFASALAQAGAETLVASPSPTATVAAWANGGGGGGGGTLPTIGSVTLAGVPQSIVNVKFSGGSNGGIYKTTVTAPTSAGNTVQINAYLPVVDDPV